MDRRQKALGLAMVAALACAVACASSGLKYKQQALSSLQASEQTLKDARAEELRLYAAAAIPNYTLARHVAFLDLLDQAQVAVQDGAKAGQAWVPGQPPPKSATDFLGLAQQLLALVQALDPGAAATLVSAAQKVVGQAQTSVNSFSGKG